MYTSSRITVEVPVLSVGSGPPDYEELGRYVDALRKPQGLHLTLLHIGVLEDFAQDIAVWTKGVTAAGDAARIAAAWLEGLPALGAFSARAERLVRLGGGRVSGLDVEVPHHVQEYQGSLVTGLRGLLDGMLVDDVDDFILSSPALGFRYPRWTPHVAVGRPKTSDRGPWPIRPLALEFGASRIRNRHHLPVLDPVPDAGQGVPTSSPRPGQMEGI